MEAKIVLAGGVTASVIIAGISFWSKYYWTGGLFVILAIILAIITASSK